MAASRLHSRVAAPDDAAQVQHLVQSAFRTEDSRQDWTGSAELASHFCIDTDEITAKLNDPDTIILVASEPDNKTIIASIEVVRRRAGLARLSMIAVAASHQQTGIGGRVLAYAEDYCRTNWGTTSFSLNALSTRKALMQWYLRRGYLETGETSSFPRDKFPHHLLPDHLCFVELEQGTSPKNGRD